jgi:DNA-binding transcriptional LysR family regulator
MNIVPIHRFDGELVLEKIDLKRLRYFLAVAEAGSFSRAAERLNVAQSHLSRQIMSLESALSHRLFVRRARHVELTDAGQILLAETTFITQKLDSLPERMNVASAGATGSLCIGLTSSGTFYPIVGRVIQSLVRQQPELSLNFSIATRAQLIEAIVDRRVQACFAPIATLASSDVRVDHLVTDPILLAIPKTHRLAGRREVDLAEIADEPFVLSERSWAPDRHDEIMAACQKAGFFPRVVCQTPQDVSALLLASAGVAITFVPASIRDVNSENLHFASIGGGLLKTSLALITRADEHIASVNLLRKRAIAVATAFHVNTDKLSKQTH